MFCYPLPIQGWKKLLCVLECAKSLHYMRAGVKWREGDNPDPYPTYLDQPHNIYDSTLDKLAHLILYLEVIIALLLALYVFYLLYKNS